LRDIVTNDSKLSMNMIILHIKNKYDINLKKNMIFEALEDAKQIVVKVQEKAIGLKTEKSDELVIDEKKKLIEDDEDFDE